MDRKLGMLLISVGVSLLVLLNLSHFWGTFLLFVVSPVFFVVFAISAKDERLSNAIRIFLGILTILAILCIPTSLLILGGAPVWIAGIASGLLFAGLVRARI